MSEQYAMGTKFNMKLKRHSLPFFHDLTSKSAWQLSIEAGFLTSKPIEPTPSTLKADLAVFVNSNMLITNIIDKNSLEYVLSSTSASKFEFLEHFSFY